MWCRLILYEIINTDIKIRTLYIDLITYLRNAFCRTLQGECVPTP